MDLDIVEILADQSGLTKETVLFELTPILEELGLSETQIQMTELRRAMALYLQKMILEATQAEIIEFPKSCTPLAKVLPITKKRQS